VVRIAKYVVANNIAGDAPCLAPSSCCHFPQKMNRGFRGWARIRDEFTRAIRVIRGLIFSAISAFSAVKNSRWRQKNCSICGKPAQNFHLLAIYIEGGAFFVVDPAVILANPEPWRIGRAMHFQVRSPRGSDKTPRHAIENGGCPQPRSQKKKFARWRGGAEN
jgi:hypothetical protein